MLLLVLALSAHIGHSHLMSKSIAQKRCAVLGLTRKEAELNVKANSPQMHYHAAEVVIEREHASLVQVVDII